MQIIKITDPQAIPLALTALERGELVIYPTETCYGLGVDASNPDAVTKLLSYKGDRHRQIAIAVHSRLMAQEYVEINPIADNLYVNFLPGPITVISNSLHQLDSRLESSSGTLGVRIPHYQFALALIQSFGRPITTTSANTSGKKEPYSLADWQKYTTPDKQNMVALFLDADHLVNRPTSTVIDTTLNSPTILRQGEIILPSSSLSFTSHSPQETISFAADLTRRHLNLTRQFPLIFALQGDLGVGKTQFSKGIATALGITKNINSPTYTLLHEYPYATPKYQGMFYHADTWRLPDMAELESTLHLSNLLLPGNILSLEWANKAQDTLASYHNTCTIILINIKELSVSTRTISYSITTPKWS